MTGLPELRVELSPAIPTSRRLSIKVVDRETGETRASTTVEPMLEPEDLKLLRLPRWNPDVARLRAIGSKIWNTVMSGPIGKEFESLERARGREPWRLVFVLHGADGAPVRLSDLPIEGMFRAAQHAFVALRMPVSRTLHAQPDRDPQSIALPLRVVVAVATPKDRTEAKASDEVKAIREALAKEIDENRVNLYVVENATVSRLAGEMRARKPHVLHFIGHGGFGSVAADATPQPYLCFEKDNGETKYVYSEGLISLAAESDETRLVVLTACSTAATANETETGLALDGMAQIIACDRQFSATVAMQFDLEPWAARAFSREFYRHLAAMDDLDNAVKRTRAQLALETDNGDGERAWLNPVVYWRCTSGRVFTFVPEETSELKAIETAAETTCQFLVQMWAAPKRDEYRAAFAPLFAERLARLNELGEQRSTEVRTCLRLVGGLQTPGQPLTVLIRLRTGVDMMVNSVGVTVTHPGLAVRVERGADTSVDPALNVADGRTRITLVQPGDDARWPAGEREIARLVIASETPALVELRLEKAALVGDGQQIRCKTVSGWACFL